MDNINKAPGGTPVRHKLKKVKRPIKTPRQHAGNAFRPA